MRRSRSSVRRSRSSVRRSRSSVRRSRSSVRRSRSSVRRSKSINYSNHLSYVLYNLRLISTIDDRDDLVISHYLSYSVL